jgi:8-oxo-dGTP pyrophosphatase MutT (NUDIX family)
MAQWRVHGERSVYESRWVQLSLVDVELPDGQRFEHHVVRMQRVAGVVVIDEDERVLLIWRHRFITDTWGWEIPMGIIEAEESGAETGAREVLEETGWQPRALKFLLRYQPANGIVNSEHELYLARGAERVGPPEDITEAERIEWVPLREISKLIANRELVSGASVVGLLYVLSGSSASPS